MGGGRYDRAEACATGTSLMPTIRDLIVQAIASQAVDEPTYKDYGDQADAVLAVLQRHGYMIVDSPLTWRQSYFADSCK